MKRSAIYIPSGNVDAVSQSNGIPLLQWWEDVKGLVTGIKEASDTPFKK